MNVLIACEESQRVCIEFRKRGGRAFSCDLMPPSGGHPEWHIIGDVMPVLNGSCQFITMDGTRHDILGKWDLIIAHPPCTYLSNAGAARLFKRVDGKSIINEDRFSKGMAAREFFLKIYNAECEHIAIENPIPSKIYCLPDYDQIIQPFWFGDPYSKKTCLWLKGLPALKPTQTVEPICSWVSGGSKKPDGTPRKNKGTKYRDSKTRSKTFPGIAAAMAEQWR